jgi:AcrR family transcriptional regulator
MGEQERLERKAARQGRRREEIVRAAAEVALGLGVDGFTADDVARALSISAPSVFYYFPGGLSELRAAVALQRFYARFDPVIARIAAAPDGIAALHAFARGLMKEYADDVDGFGTDLEVMQRGAWGPELLRIHVDRVNALFDVVEQKLRADQEAGRLHDDVKNLRRLAMLVNQLLLGLVVGDQLRRKVGGGSKHAFSALVEELCGLIERGVRR